MLSVVAPFGIADLIRGVSRSAPLIAQAVVFSILLAVYLYVIVRVGAALYCRLDYVVATAIRRRGGAPPGLQHWLGDAMAVVPSRVALMGFVLVAGTVGFAVLAYGLKPPSGSAWGQIQTFWSFVITKLWQ
ncbi:hypothetical protein [Methylobacterium sp. SyP6R]|uniref:hypothetical protein n=1 Tax=Methylobacterium sp. SyP6R TaxID=2718876 RepID=UPI001F21C968|nr:hypothetical protein [Methylobacterium sp. SyP6R]MCF4127615.1 hypothetical protein [Methylobacterium sp. SyP6R]